MGDTELRAAFFLFLIVLTVLFMVMKGDWYAYRYA